MSNSPWSSRDSRTLRRDDGSGRRIGHGWLSISSTLLSVSSEELKRRAATNFGLGRGRTRWLHRLRDLRPLDHLGGWPRRAGSGERHRRTVGRTGVRHRPSPSAKGLRGRHDAALLQVPALEQVALFAAGVEPDNTASVRCLLSAGFGPLDPEAGADWEGLRVLRKAEDLNGRDVCVLFNVGRLVGQAALAPRPADLPRLPGRAERTARRPTAAHEGNVAGDGVRADFQGRPMSLDQSPGSSVQASRCRSTTTPMPSLTEISTSRSTLPKRMEDESAGHGALYIHCQDADQVAEDWRAAGIDVDGPRDEDYGKREGFNHRPRRQRDSVRQPHSLRERLRVVQVPARDRSPRKKAQGSFRQPLSKRVAGPLW